MEFLVHTPGQLAQVLRGRRKRLGLTQKRAGKEVGLQTKTISALESVPERSSVQSLFRLLSALEFELVLRPKSSEPVRPGTPEW